MRECEYINEIITRSTFLFFLFSFLSCFFIIYCMFVVDCGSACLLGAINTRGVVVAVA